MYMGGGGSLYSLFECQNVFHHAFSVQVPHTTDFHFVLVLMKCFYYYYCYYNYCYIKIVTNNCKGKTLSQLKGKDSVPLKAERLICVQIANPPFENPVYMPDNSARLWKAELRMHMYLLLHSCDLKVAWLSTHRSQQSVHLLTQYICPSHNNYMPYHCQ